MDALGQGLFGEEIGNTKDYVWVVLMKESLISNGSTNEDYFQESWSIKLQVVAYVNVRWFEKKKSNVI